MFDGIQRRVVSLWFPRLASDRVLRHCPLKGSFVLTLKQSNANRLYCLNAEATHQGMSSSDARAFCPSLKTAPTAYSEPISGWASLNPRPLCLFSPEPIAATGPERIAPEWWLEDDSWRSGLRDYWRVATTQGRRLWLFYTPQNPGWFVQGEFP